jgi:hypothetical protein
MRKPVPLSTILLFLAVQSTLLIDVMHTPSSHEPAMNPHTTPKSQGAPRTPAIRDNYEAARQMLAAGRLQEAQDEYVSILLLKPDDSKAMQGLVGVRRRMGGGFRH